MSALNSVLLEGVTTGPAKVIDEVVQFMITSDEDWFTVEVAPEQSKLSELVLRTILTNQAVRIVGKLARFGNGVVIRADHVEYRTRILEEEEEE